MITAGPYPLAPAGGRLAFIENVGQIDVPTETDKALSPQFEVRTGVASIFLAPSAIWIDVVEPVTPTVMPKGWGPKQVPLTTTTNLPSPKRVNLRLTLAGASPDAKLSGFGRLATRYSYFLGKDPKQWHADAPAWQGVRYTDIYPGIDLETTSGAAGWDWRFVVRRGLDAAAVTFLSHFQLGVDGTSGLLLPQDKKASLHLVTPIGTYTLPLIGIVDGQGQPLSLGQIRATEQPAIVGNQVTFPFAQARSNLSAPQPNIQSGTSGLIYAGLLGGSSDDAGYGIAVDSMGATYVAGSTTSSDFITTTGVLSPAYSGATDVFVTKLLPDGSGLAYSTYLGGSSTDYGNAVAVDTSGAAYVTGETSSTDFPTQSAYATTNSGGYDAFVTKLNATGTVLSYSTYLGGSGTDTGYGIAVDSNGAAYVTGATSSTNFPTQSAYAGTNSGYTDAFVTKLAPAGNTLSFSTYLGGTSYDFGYAIAVDAAGEAYVTGETYADPINSSNGFPSTPGAYGTTCSCGNYPWFGLTSNGFFTKFASDGSHLLYSTFFGEWEDIVAGYAMAIGTDGTAYVTGNDTPHPCFDCRPVHRPASLAAYLTWGGGFVLKFDPSQSGAASLVYGLDIAGFSGTGYGAAVDNTGAAYVAGSTTSSGNAGTAGAFQPTYNGGNSDGFVAKILPDGSAASYFTYLGSAGTDAVTGLALGGPDQVYVTGYTTATNFPTTSGSFNTAFLGGTYDAFVVKLNTMGGPYLPPSQAFATNECPFCDNRSRVYIAGSGINAYSGNFNSQDIGGQIPGALGLPLSFDSSYNSLATGVNLSYTTIYTSVLGYGWTHNFNVNLVLSPTGELPNVVMLIAPRGSQLRFTDNGNGSYTPKDGVTAQLARTGSPGAYTYVATTNSQYVYTFNNNGQLLSVADPPSAADPQHRVTSLTYTGGKLSQIMDASGHFTLALSYNGNGLLQSVTDVVGNRTATYSYTASDLTGVTDMNGMTWAYVYTGSTHLLWKVIDPTNRTLIETRYDSQGRATQQYDGLGNLIAQVNYSTTVPNTSQVLSVSPLTGNLVTTTVTYDGGLPVAVQNAQGNQTQTSFSPSLNPSVTADGRGYTTTSTYSGALLTSVTDPLSNTWQYAYTNLNFPAVITDARHFVQTNTYSGTLLTAHADALGNTTLYTYTTGADAPEPAGLVRYQQDLRGAIMRYQYNPQGQVLTQTANYVSPGTFDPAQPDRNLITSDTYDSQGRQVTVTDPAGRVSRTDYDPTSGLVITTTQDYLAGQPPGYLNLYNHITTYGYDAAGRTLITTINVGTSLAQTQVNNYDSAGRLTSVTRNYLAGQGPNYLHQYNLITQYGYDAGGDRIQVTDPLGHVTRTWYDDLRRPVTVTTNYTGSGAFAPFNSAHPDQNITTLTAYDPNGNVVSTTELYGSAQQHATYTWYDPDNRPVTVTANYTGSGAFVPFNSAYPDQNLTTLTGYDPNGNVISTTALYGSAQQRTTYTWVDPLNRPVTGTTNYTGSGAFVAFNSSYPDQNLTALTGYDPNGNTNATTKFYGAGSTVQRTNLTQFDGLNRPVTVTTNATGGQGTDQNLQTITAYNSAGQVSSVTEGYGTSQARTTHTEYDAVGRPVTVTTNYDGTGIAGADRNLMQVTVYGPAGEQDASAERRVYPDGTTAWITTTNSYNNLGQLIQTTFPLTGGVVASTTLAYNELGRVITSTDALGHPTVTQYDGLGRAVAVTINYVDGVFNPSKPDEDLTTHTTYDAAGNRVAVQDPDGVVTQYAYDRQNRLAGVVENYVQGAPSTTITNVTTLYTYNAAGDRVSLQDGRNKVSTFTYDQLDRPVTTVDPLTHTTVYTYNAAGDKVALLDANGQVTSYTYDLLDRQTAITYPAGTPSVAFAYDVLSQRTAMTDGTGTTTWSYDGLGRPITITQPNIGAVGYGYDSAGDRTQLSYPDGKVVTYTYDLAARLTAVTDWGAKTTQYSYNAMGQPVTVALPNGVTSRYRYDNAGRVAVISHTTLTQTLAAYTYTVDAVGNRVQVIESTQFTATLAGTPSHGSMVPGGALAADGSRGSLTALTGGSAFLAFTHLQHAVAPTTTYGLSTTTIGYAYDPLYRLTAANYSSGKVYTYTYDAVGNRLADGAPAGVTTYAYDDANRQTTINGTVNYTWDNNGNLINNGQGSTYAYDAENRLTALNTSVYTFTYNGLSARVQQASSSGPIVYVLDQAAGLTQVLAETKGANTTTYLYGQVRLAQQTATNTDYFLGDGLGSVRGLVDPSGKLTLQKGYDPFGQTISSSGTDSSNFDFTGEYKDPSALFYLRARYYTAKRGRFIQADSWNGNLDKPGTLDRYVYGLNDPTLMTDPSGNWCVVGFDLGPGGGCTDQDRQSAAAFVTAINNERTFNEGFSIELLDTLAMGIPGLLGQLSDDQIRQLTSSIPWLTTQLLLNRCGLRTGQPDPWYGPLIYNPNPFFQAGRMVGRGASLALGGAEIAGGSGGAFGSLALEIPTFGAATVTLAGSAALAGHGVAVWGTVVVKEISDPLLAQSGIIIARAVAAGAGEGSHDGGSGIGSRERNAKRLAGLADGYFQAGSAATNEKRWTVAILELNGKLKVALNSSAYNLNPTIVAIVRNLAQTDGAELIAPDPGYFHAEELLVRRFGAELNGTEMGVSRAPCPDCAPLLKQFDIVVWPKP